MSTPIIRTPTETIVAAMEEAETAQECLIIMTDKDGSIITLGSTSVRSTRLGLIEMAKALILAGITSGIIKEER